MLPCQFDADTISALELHRKCNFTSMESPLASYRLPSGSLIPLTRCKFLARLNGIFEPRDLPIVTGHCLRIGGTTHLLLSRIPPDVVKLLSRWSSDAFLRYWRSLEVIAPFYVELLMPIMRESGTLRHSASKGVIGYFNARRSSKAGLSHCRSRAT